LCPLSIAQAATSENLDDLVQLSEVSEPGIIHLLRHRFQRDLIYTWVRAGDQNVAPRVEGEGRALLLSTACC